MEVYLGIDVLLVIGNSVNVIVVVFMGEVDLGFIEGDVEDLWLLC